MERLKACAKKALGMIAQPPVALMLITCAMITMAGTDAFAGGPGGAASDGEFLSVMNKVKGWATGNLSRTIALATFLVGIGISVGKQTLFPAIMGIIVAFTAAYGPTVIDSIFTATIP